MSLVETNKKWQATLQTPTQAVVREHELVLLLRAPVIHGDPLGILRSVLAPWELPDRIDDGGVSPAAVSRSTSKLTDSAPLDAEEVRRLVAAVVADVFEYQPDTGVSIFEQGSDSLDYVRFETALIEVFGEDVVLDVFDELGRSVVIDEVCSLLERAAAESRFAEEGRRDLPTL